MTISKYVETGLFLAIPGLATIWLLNIPLMLGISIVTASYLMMMTGLGVAAGLISTSGAGKDQFINLLLAVAALGTWFWGAYQHESWLVSFSRGPEKWVPAAIALLLLMEALRRVCGRGIFLVVVGAAIYGFWGYLLPGPLEGAYTAPSRLVLYFFSDTNGVPGVVLGVATTIVMAFILLGAVMGETGASTFFTDLAMSTMGHRRGGPAKVAVLASSLFGTISGSTLGNIMTTGVITIPLMKRSGIPPHTAGAIEAVASNGGQLAPPVMGATAFLIAEFLQVPYSEVVLAAVIPASIYYLILFLQIDAIANRLNLACIPKEELPLVAKVLRSGWLFAVPLAYLIYLLFWMGAAPGSAALYATAAMLVAGCIVTRVLPGPALVIRIFLAAGKTFIPILLICAAAGIVIAALNITGLGFLLTNAVAHIGETMGLFPMLFLTALIAIFLGMGMPTAAVYIVLSIILAPALVRMGIPPMAAHLFIFYYGLLSMITPPVAIATYAAGALAGADLWSTGLAGLRLGIAAYFLPFLFCFNPALIGDGSIWQVGFSIINAAVAGYMLALAMGMLEDFSPRKDLTSFAGLCASALALIVFALMIGVGHMSVALVTLAAFTAAVLWRRRHMPA